MDPPYHVKGWSKKGTYTQLLSQFGYISKVLGYKRYPDI
jgi:hypothetical protein